MMVDIQDAANTIMGAGYAQFDPGHGPAAREAFTKILNCKKN